MCEQRILEIPSDPALKSPEGSFQKDPTLSNIKTIKTNVYTKHTN